MPQLVAYVPVSLPRVMTGQQIADLIQSMEETARGMKFQSLSDDLGVLIGLASEVQARNLCVSPDQRFGPVILAHRYERLVVGSYDWSLTRPRRPVVFAGGRNEYLKEVLLFAERLEAELHANDAELRSPEGWLNDLHPRLVMDGQGWRGGDFREPITMREFKQRLQGSRLTERSLEHETTEVRATPSGVMF